MMLLVCVAAAVGGLARWQLGVRVNAGRVLPLGTLAANLSASFALGLLSGAEGTSDVVVRVGLLGALSTWSTLANEVIELGRTEGRGSAAAYLSMTLVGGVAVAWLGLRMAAM